MKSLTTSAVISTCLAIVLGINSPAAAGKLRQTDLPSNVEAVIHLDWDAARSSNPMRSLSRQVGEGMSSSGYVGDAAAKLFNAATLHDLTLVTTSAGETLQYVRADIDVDKLKQILSNANGYVVVKHTREIHHWIGVPRELESTDPTAKDAEAKEAPTTIFLAQLDETSFVIGKRLKPVVQAIDRFEGQAGCASDESFATLSRGASDNTMILASIQRGAFFANAMPGLPVASAHAVVNLRGDACEMICEATMTNELIAGAVLNALQTENLVEIFQAYAVKAAADAAGDKAGEEEKPEKPSTEPDDGKRSLNLGFGVKNIDSDTMHAMLSQAFKTTSEGALVRIQFRGVVEPTVEITGRKLAISLTLDGDKTDVAAREETIR